MKKILILCIALISFSGFAATFDTEDVGDKMEMVVDVGVQSVDAILQVGDVTFETSISADARINLYVYEATSVTAQTGNLTTLTQTDDVGWQINLVENKEANYVENMFMRTDHPQLLQEVRTYNSINITAIRERYANNTFSC